MSSRAQGKDYDYEWEAPSLTQEQKRALYELSSKPAKIEVAEVAPVGPYVSAERQAKALESIAESLAIMAGLTTIDAVLAARKASLPAEPVPPKPRTAPVRPRPE